MMDSDMFRKVLFLTVLLPTLVLAQAPSREKATLDKQLNTAARFDPAVFLSTLHINQIYIDGKIRTPAGMRSTFVDTIWSNQRALAFSIRLEPESGEGWQMWLDFDADVYYRHRLIRILAQRRMGEKRTDAFETYRDWVATVQKHSIGAAVNEKAGQVSWPWLTRTSYYLTLRQELADGVPWLLLVLQHEETRGDS
jgi:hypothetical protein